MVLRAVRVVGKAKKAAGWMQAVIDGAAAVSKIDDPDTGGSLSDAFSKWVVRNADKEGLDPFEIWEDPKVVEALYQEYIRLLRTWPGKT